MVPILASGEVRPLAHKPPTPIRCLREAYSGQTFEEFGILRDPHEAPAATLHLITLRNAVLSFLPGLEGVVATEDGRLVAETTFLTDPAERSRVLSGAPQAVRIEAPLLHATDAWFWNYYHWLIIALGKSLFAEDVLGPEVFRVFPEFTRRGGRGSVGFSEEVRAQTLARFSSTRPRMTLGPGLYRVPELHLLWTELGHSELHMLLDEFYAPFQACAAEVRGDVGNKVLILRRDDARMSETDRTTISEVAGAFGYTPVHLEDASFEEELALFSDASHVIGPHGSGMANIVFCRPGTRVLELNKDLDGLGYVRPWIYLLANGAGHEYRCLTRFKGDFTRARLEGALDRMEG